MQSDLEQKFQEISFLSKTWGMGYAKGCDYKPLIIPGTENRKDTDGKMTAQIQMNQGILHMRMYPLMGPSETEVKRLEEKATVELTIINDVRNSETKIAKAQKRLDEIREMQQSLKNYQGSRNKTIAQKLKCENNLIDITKALIQDKPKTVSYTLEVFKDGKVIEMDREGSPNFEEIAAKYPAGNYRMTRYYEYAKEEDPDDSGKVNYLEVMTTTNQKDKKELFVTVIPKTRGKVANEDAGMMPKHRQKKRQNEQSHLGSNMP